MYIRIGLYYDVNEKHIQFLFMKMSLIVLTFKKPPKKTKTDVSLFHFRKLIVFS